MPLRRRRFVRLALAALGAPSVVSARPPTAPQDMLRMGADTALVACGFADALVHGFGAYAGLALHLEAGPSSAVLDALERGELDVALSMAPQPEEKLDAQGLVHDRHAVAATDFVLVGPRDPAVTRPGGDVVAVLARIAAAGLPFVGCNDGSGAHWCEQTLWRTAKVAPAAPWYRTTTSDQVMALAREQQAHALLDRAAYLGAQKSLPAAGLVLKVERDPLLSVPVHVMRSFRVNHPSGKLFVAWAAGPLGRQLAARQRGFNAVTG